MQLLIAIFFLFSLAFSKEMCLDFSEIDLEDPYVKKAVIQKLEQYAIESGFILKCSESSKRIKVFVSYSEKAISISARQRVSTYIFSLNIQIGDESFSSSVPYSLPSGALAELPRRKALEEMMGRLKLPIIKYFSEIYLGKSL
ncbi:MAG TPA: hypothetical protein EYP32_07000 [Aquificaceae bacterium]|nr:hypothetical protein [Aquificaceae bacterium]HIQ48778.1 hypothetical protein [Aquifex aeolicus]